MPQQAEPEQTVGHAGVSAAPFKGWSSLQQPEQEWSSNHVGESTTPQKGGPGRKWGEMFQPGLGNLIVQKRPVIWDIREYKSIEGTKKGESEQRFTRDKLEVTNQEPGR